MEASQNAAFWPVGLSTVTWQSYLPGGSCRSARLNSSGAVFSRSLAPLFTTMGWVSKAFFCPAYRLTNATSGWKRFRALLVGLQVDVHVAALAEDSRHAGNQLLAVADQGVGRFSPVLALYRVIKRFLQVHALAAQHHRADGNALLFLIQIRDHKGGLVGPDAARLGVPRQKLDGVFPGQQREARVVLDGPLG